MSDSPEISNEIEPSVPVSNPDSSETRDEGQNDITQGLVERINQGDQAAIGEVWNLLGDDLRRRARNRLRQYGISGKAESMDICNSVLVHLIKRQTVDINQPSQVIAYLCRAIDNQVIDVCRQLSRQRRDHRREENQPVEDFSIKNNEASAGTNLVEAEVLDQVRNELGDDGSKFLALYLARHSWQEIGEQFDMSADAARMKWHRAIDKVRKKMA